METKELTARLAECRVYFERSTRCLEEEDADFAPAEGMMTAAQQVAHVAQTVEWFMEGAFRPEGFDLDFEKHARDVAKTRSLAEARERVGRAFDEAIALIGSKSAEELSQPLPEGPVMGGEPRDEIVHSIVDHTAHHRGALTAYSRLRGHVPAMPYME